MISVSAWELKAKVSLIHWGGKFGDVSSVGLVLKHAKDTEVARFQDEAHTSGIYCFCSDASNEHEGR